MVALRGRTAYVSGAAGGIGAGIARALAAEGVHLALTDVQAEPLARMRAQIQAIGVRCVTRVVDVADRAAVYAAAAEFERELGAIHLCVNNAGVGYPGKPLVDVPDGDFDWVIGVNLYGVIHGIKAFLPRIKAHGEGGHVVNIASVAGLYLIPGLHHGLYAATKAAVIALSEGLRQDLDGTGIGVSVVCPGSVKTDLFHSSRLRPQRYGGGYERDSGFMVQALAQAGMAADLAGRWIVEAVKAGEFYVFTQPGYRPEIEGRFTEIRGALERAVGLGRALGITDVETAH